MTKVDAIVKVMKANAGSATLSEIYQKIGRYYKGAKASKEWQAGIRGVLYPEIRNGHTLKKIGDATFALKMYKATNDETGQEVMLTEAEVREEFYETMSHDMGTVFNETEEDIRKGAMTNSFDDMFDSDTFEGFNWFLAV
jgi:hypothetical protein